MNDYAFNYLRAGPGHYARARRRHINRTARNDVDSPPLLIKRFSF